MRRQVVLNSLRMENFGCFRDRTVTFEPELNQLIGPNESGKSTVLRGLLTAIFEDGTTRKKNISQPRNWNRKSPFKLTLKFSVGDKEFTLIRDHGTGRDIMTDSDGITYEGRTIGENLGIYFGTPDRNLFESVFCFSSDDPASLEKQKSRLKSALETPVFSGFDRTKADDYLEEEIKKIDNPRAHGPRKLDLLDEQIQSYLQQKSELDRRMEALAKDKAELDTVRENIKQHEDDLSRLERLVIGGEAYRTLDTRMAGLDERLQTHLANYSRAQQAAEDLERVGKELAGITVPEPGEIEEIETRRNELVQTVDQAKRGMDELIVRRVRAKRDFMAVTLLLVFLCLVYVIQQMGYYDTGPVADITPYTIPVMTLIWVVGMSAYLSCFRRKKKATTIFRGKVAEMDGFYAELNDRCNLKAADPIKAIHEQITRRQTLGLSAENLAGRVDLLSDGKGLEHLAEVKRQLEAEVAQINKEFAPLVEFASVAGQVAELKEELTAKRVRCNAFRERAALLTERCSAIEPLKNSFTKVENELEALKREYKEIVERLEILRITRAALNRAADQLIEQTFAAYSDEASTYLADLTDRRYEELRFSKEIDAFELKVNNTDNWYGVGEYLSSSTRDVVYMALHLAAMDRLSGDYAVPVIFDQAGARMDENRRRNFFDLLSRLASRRQVVYAAVGKGNLQGESHIIEFDLETSEVTREQTV